MNRIVVVGRIGSRPRHGRDAAALPSALRGPPTSPSRCTAEPASTCCGNVSFSGLINGHYAFRMRYLTRQFALGALRRGNGIEQFLGGAEIDGEPAVRWVAISPMNRRYRISLHTVRDPDDDRVGDLPNLISLDPVDEAYVGEGREVGLSEDEEDAVSLAEHLTDARPDRWVNHAVAGEEYIDYVRSRRDPVPLT